MSPLAPVRLSTRKFCPMLFWNAVDKSRAWMSVPPPGGTIIKALNRCAVASRVVLAEERSGEAARRKQVHGLAAPSVLLCISGAFEVIPEGVARDRDHGSGYRHAAPRP